MFRSATLRLTLWYLTIIMLLSAMFSSVLYQVLSSELTNSLSRQAIVLQELPAFTNGLYLRQSDLNAIRQQQIDEAKKRVLLELLYWNLSILGLGGMVSFWLARRTLKPIELAHKAQVRFTSDASHELRTPLAVMKAEIEVLLREKRITEGEARASLASNLEEINKLESLSSGLLRLAQMDERESTFSVGSLKEILIAAADRATASATAKDIRIIIEGKDLSVEAETDLLTELFAILLDNAVKYSPSGSSVVMHMGRTPGAARISVSDEGVGIKAMDLPYIFNRFYRSDVSRSKDVSGYGIGLSIAEVIAKRHRGTIGVESELGKGSVFTVSIPLRRQGSMSGLTGIYR